MRQFCMLRTQSRERCPCQLYPAYAIHLVRQRKISTDGEKLSQGVIVMVNHEGDHSLCSSSDHGPSLVCLFMPGTLSTRTPVVCKNMVQKWTCLAGCPQTKARMCCRVPVYVKMSPHLTQLQCLTMGQLSGGCSATMLTLLPKVTK